MPPEHWIKKISWVETEWDGARLSHVPLCSSLCADFINETVQPWKHVKSSSPVGQTGTESLQVMLARRPLSTSRTCPGCNKLLQPEDPRGYLHTRTATTSKQLQQPPQEKKKVKQPQRRAARLQTDESKDNETADRQWKKTLKMNSIRQNKDMQDDHKEAFVCSILVIKGLKIHSHAQSGCGAYNGKVITWMFTEPPSVTHWVRNSMKQRSWGWSGL